MYQPFVYQNECLQALKVTRESGADKALIIMASGLGKTVTMGFDVKEFLKHNPGRVLYLCQNNDVLYQARATFEVVNGSDKTYGYFMDGKKHIHQVDFLFASLQTMAESKEIFDPEEFAYVVVDESHHSHAETYRATIEYFKPKFLLGATATPDRLDQLDIRTIFGSEVYCLSLQQALARGLLTPIDYRLMTDEIRLAKVLETDEGVISISQLNRKIFIPKRDEEIAKIIQHHVAQVVSPRVIIFCASIKHCEHLAHFVPGSFAIHSKTPDKERKVKLEMFRQGMITTILTVNAFNEGVDIPEANIIIFLRSTVSSAIFLQQLGRGLRLSEGKDKVLVLDFVGNCERIKMVYTLWQEIKELSEKYTQEGQFCGARESMTMNVGDVRFQETVIPLLALLDRLNPTFISQVEHLKKEYDPKNRLAPEYAVAGSKEKYHWICSTCSHEWQASGNNRVRGIGCPACTNRAVTDRNNLAVTHPELAKEYLPPPSNEKSANQIVAGTAKKLWWCCGKCDHNWEMRGRSRVEGQGCPACAGRVVTNKNNLLATYPELAKEYMLPPWNELPADKIVGGTAKRVRWKCSQPTCGHEWEVPCYVRAKRGAGCPACAGMVVTGNNNITITHPDIAREYSLKNEIPAEQVIAGSKKKYWWKCECGNEWYTSALSRKKGSKCPKCSMLIANKKRKVSWKQKRTQN